MISAQTAEATTEVKKMRIDLPGCGFKNCRYSFDGNCTKPNRQEKCEYWYLLHKELYKPEPERKKGKWLMNGEIYGHMYWRCSQCGEEVDYIGANFCPNCGSFNGGEEDE